MNKRPTELIFFGRLEERKGLFEFVEAVNRILATDDPGFTVTFLGKVVPLASAKDGACDSEAFIKAELNGAINYSILGHLDSRAAINYVQNASDCIVCLTSPSDNFPNAALEMGQIRQKLVVSDTIGFHQTLGLIGRTTEIYWFKPKCPISLAQAIRSAIDAPVMSTTEQVAVDTRKLNQELLRERLELLDAAFAKKLSLQHAAPARIKTAVILSPPAARSRCIRRSLLSLGRCTVQPESTVVVTPGRSKPEIERLKVLFHNVRFVQEDHLSLQDIVHSTTGGYGLDDYAVVMIAGVAVGSHSLANFAKAGRDNPALITSAEEMAGARPLVRSFFAPTVSRLVRTNDSCGSCLAISMKFVDSIPSVPLEHPALALWFLVVTAAAQGRRCSYLPLPQHSLRRRHVVSEQDQVSDEEQSALWRYISTIDTGSWSLRELRHLVLSVQQLAHSETELQQSRVQLHHANTELYNAKTELYNAKTELHHVNVVLHETRIKLNGVLASYAWRITKPLRLAADFLRNNLMR